MKKKTSIYEENEAKDGKRRHHRSGMTFVCVLLLWFRAHSYASHEFPHFIRAPCKCVRRASVRKALRPHSFHMLSDILILVLFFFFTSFRAGSSARTNCDAVAW